MKSNKSNTYCINKNICCESKKVVLRDTGPEVDPESQTLPERERERENNKKIKKRTKGKPGQTVETNQDQDKNR